MAIKSAVRRLLQGQYSVTFSHWRIPSSNGPKRHYSDDGRGPSKPHPSTSFRKQDLWAEYDKTKAAVEAQDFPIDQDAKAVYANNELDLQEIDVYGFDYDYTLASYKPTLHYLIYNLGKDKLVREQKYPRDIAKFEYDPSFAIRGLHCDIGKGILLKIDAFHNIQMGTAYKGLRHLSDNEIHQLYNGTHVSIENMSSFHGTGPNMLQLMDLFALPEITLFSSIIQYFETNNIPYDPEYVFYDVRSAVQGLHSSGVLHNEILRNISVFLSRGKEVPELLKRLADAGKKLFLITNSGISFVDAGMKYLVGTEWQKLFDVIITNARKPKFFYDSTRPFRSYDVDFEIKSWDRVTELKKGEFYQEGNLFSFQELTGWYGSKVLYFGDHVYSDLADAALKHGWRTGAIIPELEHEIEIINSTTYKSSIRWLMALEALIQRTQVYEDPELKQVHQEWLEERNKLRHITKKVFNPRFGSVFRTYHNQSYFTRRLNRFADVYMSSIMDLLSYPLNYTFYPRRSALPHELEFYNLESHKVIKPK